MADISSAASRTLVDRVADWLMAQALSDTALEALVRGCCERMQAAGIPIARVQLSFSVLHPLYRALGFTWRRGHDLKVEGYRHRRSEEASEPFLKSPYYHIVKHGLDHLRRRLDAGGTDEFPIFADLRKEGLTDYLGFRIGFDAAKTQGVLGSWATDQQGGFKDEEIAALLRIQDRLAVACKMAVRGEVARSALSTYLGGKAGERILSGQIKRGDGETIRAAIVWGDLRGSTRMAEQLGRQAYIDALNQFFDCAAGAIAEAGGEILSFVGDGFLTIFPCGRNRKESSEVCQQALAAAIEAAARIAAANRDRADRGQPALGYGLALHIGNVMFGNVGLPDRLTFSAFGSAVNEAARLESLTKSLATPIVASEDFKAYCGGTWKSLGAERLPGVGRAMAVFQPELGGGGVPHRVLARREEAPGLSDAEAVMLLHRGVSR